MAHGVYVQGGGGFVLREAAPGAAVEISGVSQVVEFGLRLSVGALFDAEFGIQGATNDHRRGLGSLSATGGVRVQLWHVRQARWIEPFVRGGFRAGAQIVDRAPRWVVGPRFGGGVLLRWSPSAGVELAAGAESVLAPLSLRLWLSLGIVARWS